VLARPVIVRFSMLGMGNVSYGVSERAVRNHQSRIQRMSYTANTRKVIVTMFVALVLQVSIAPSGFSAAIIGETRTVKAHSNDAPDIEARVPHYRRLSGADVTQAGANQKARP